MYFIKTEQGEYLDDSGQVMTWHSEELAENYASLLEFADLCEHAEVVEDEVLKKLRQINMRP